MCCQCHRHFEFVTDTQLFIFNEYSFFELSKNVSFENVFAFYLSTTEMYWKSIYYAFYCFFFYVCYVYQCNNFIKKCVLEYFYNSPSSVVILFWNCFYLIIIHYIVLRCFNAIVSVIIHHKLKNKRCMYQLNLLIKSIHVCSDNHLKQIRRFMFVFQELRCHVDRIGYILR